MQIINKGEHPEYAIVNANLIIISKEAFDRIQQEKARCSNIVIDDAGINGAGINTVRKSVNWTINNNQNGGGCMTTFEASLLTDMRDGICKAGGVFYQYRPCRRNAETIYDIENIRHGVVYAQTPLNMNDPFDSMIGFSAEEFYEDCIDQLVNAINLTDPVQKAVITMLLRYKALGKMAETIQFLNNIANHLFARKKAMHLTHLSTEEFINRHLSTLYSKCPKDIKKQFSIQEFYIYAQIVSRMDRVPITAQNLSNMYSLDSVLEQLYKQAIELRDTQYIPNIRKVLSQLTVSCFSVSGWDNQLMWSHYANSYSGICIEYDFSKIQGFKGFIYPVEYNSHRPTLKMRDLGINLINRDGQAEYAKVLQKVEQSAINPVYRKYEKLDRIIRQQNMNRTNGLLIGPLFSRVVMESLLTRIDIDLGNDDLKYSRYVDDYEVYLWNEDPDEVISKFTRVLKRYGLSLNYEKTELVDFPYYVVENLSKLFHDSSSETLKTDELMRLFNSFLKMEKTGTKGAIRYLLKSIEKEPIRTENPALYKAYLMNILANDERSLVKACSVLIKNDSESPLTNQDVLIIQKLMEKHMSSGHDLEVIWLVYLLLETDNLSDSVVQMIEKGTNELAQSLLLRKGKLCTDQIHIIAEKAVSWILLYELYASDAIDESRFIQKLGLEHNLDMYKKMKQRDHHFIY